MNVKRVTIQLNESIRQLRYKSAISPLIPDRELWNNRANSVMELRDAIKSRDDDLVASVYASLDDESHSHIIDEVHAVLPV